MVKVPNKAENEPKSLVGSWVPEYTQSTVQHGKGHFHTDRIMEQKAATNDTSDYLWYMTSVTLEDNDPIKGNHVTLRVNTAGHGLHAYVGDKYIGSQWAKYGQYSFTFEKQTKLKHKLNHITLLSGTAGLPNYGGNFDTVPVGIVGVQLIRKHKDEEITMDLSQHKWVYKVGLNGEERQHYKLQPANWKTIDLPTNRMLTWYKTHFQAPLGTDPIVVDLQGMGKGHAWVNGKSLGQYWPSYLADEKGCSDTCDHRGTYSTSKCLTNCGKPSGKTLVLFEELRGNPFDVNFRTVTIGTACAHASEGRTVELSCQGGQTILEVRFASFRTRKVVVDHSRKVVMMPATLYPLFRRLVLAKRVVQLMSLNPHLILADFPKSLAVEVSC